MTRSSTPYPPPPANAAGITTAATEGWGAADVAPHRAELNERIARSQKAENSIGLYWPRRVSRHLTRALLLHTGVSANHLTAAWAALSVANTYLVYRAMTDAPHFVLLVFAVLFLVQVLDCTDGEIARCRGTASPIGGKLLDGMAHKATEYSLLVAFVAGASAGIPTALALPLGLALISGEAMYSYCYERRLLMIRLHAKVQTYISRVTANDLYRFDQRWADFPLRKKLNTFIGLVMYKSIYFMIALAFISPAAAAAGLAVLAAYKHYAWMRLLGTTLRNPPELRTQSPA